MHRRLQIGVARFGDGRTDVGGPPAEFGEQIKAEFEIYKKVVQAQNLKID